MINTSNTSTIHITGKKKRSRFSLGRSVTLTSGVIASLGRFSVRFGLVALAACFVLSALWSTQVFSHGGATIASAEESIGLFSSASLTTPKTTFNLGEKAWALETGAPLPFLGNRQRRIQWVAPDGTVVQQNNITMNDQSDSYQISTSAQVGTWRVKTVDNSNGGFAVAEFVVRDPNNAAANLSVNVFGSFQVAAGNNITYNLQVTNYGPDDAQNVQITDTVPSGATFQSITNVPDWSCAGGDTTTCSIASLAKGATANFTIVYHVDADAPADTTISNTADVSSNTTELHHPDNTSNTSATVAAAAACTLGCPDSISQAHDPGMNGAIVNYAAPTTSSDGCNPVTCNPPSGSFLLAGITNVTCSSQNSGVCSFTVTVTGTVAITLNGTDPFTVECHTEFKDPGATAQNGSGSDVPVTASGNVDANTPGTYTATYTATDGSSTATATRTVNVVDTTPPTITLNGADTITVEYGSVFTDPGATASDLCAGNMTSAIVVSGVVNTSVLGSYTLTYTVSDGTNTATTTTRTVNVMDTAPPTITLSGTPVTLWPPNHKYVTINLAALVVSASDGYDLSVNRDKVVIAHVSSDEPNGDNDIVIATNCKSVQLRAERNGNGNGRVYTITFKVKDGSGNVATASKKVTVPHDQGNSGAAVDDGPAYTVLSNCP